RDCILDRAALGVTGVALGHNHEIRVQFVLHVDGSTVADDRVTHWNDVDPGILCLAFAFDRLVVDANAGEAGPDTVMHQAAHRHYSAVPGIAVDDDWY